jgi:hypothetical protein
MKVLRRAPDTQDVREIGATQGPYPITELIAYESQRLRRL